MAEVVPFPITRRRAFIARQAHVAAGMRPEAGERYIQHQLNTQAASMRRKGVADFVIQRELNSMELAIRTTMDCRRIWPGGAS
ncbi:DUF6074 family protein [Bradyrhizobium sp. 195]|uniref:DUF6074 family protein n=1 Tax=Bradyrhizobium sp. 195 TaxID=2782662 RepID=UPI0020009E78|nr:DUF6074 family protein [Bradyrhizobium sp. 195]UPK28388.1 DUF6074 family protein [Bradyrhizobium sp. 195]